MKAGDFEYCYKGINHTKKKTTPAKEFKVVEEEEEAQSGELNETMEEKDESKDELKKDSDDEDSVEDIDESKDELKTDSDDEDSGEDIDESKDELKKDSDDEDSGEDMNSEDADSEDDPQISGYDIVDDTFITDLLTQVLIIAEKKKTINDNEHDQFVLPVTNAVIPEGSTILPFNFGDLPRDTVAALMAASAVVANTSPGFDNAIAGEVARERESFDSEIIPPSEYDENDNRFNRFEALSIDDNNVEESDDDNRFDDYSPNTSNYSGGIKKTDKIQFYLVLG